MIFKKTLKKEQEMGASISLGCQKLMGRSGFLLSKVAQRIRDNYDESLKDLGVNARHAGLLTILEEKGSISQSELGSWAHIDRTTIVALIDDLEKAGFVERKEHPTDRRSHAIYLTAKGKEIMPQIEKIAKEREQEFLEPLAAQEQKTLLQILRKLVVHHYSMPKETR